MQSMNLYKYQAQLSSCAFLRFNLEDIGKIFLHLFFGSLLLDKMEKPSHLLPQGVPFSHAKIHGISIKFFNENILIEIPLKIASFTHFAIP